MFDDVLRFWLDRGVDGFRVDVAHGLFKDARLRDEKIAPSPSSRHVELAARDRHQGRADVGPARGPRGLPRLAPGPRRVRRRPDGRGRGLDPDAGAHRGVRAPRRAPAGVQLRLAAGQVGRRRHGRLHPPHLRHPRPRRRQPDLGAVQPRRGPPRHAVRRRAGRRRPRPRRHAGDAGAARVVVPLPGRGARPRERRRPRGAAAGPRLVPHRRRVARPLPRADAVERHQAAVRVRRPQAAVAADARVRGRTSPSRRRPASAGRRSRCTARR